MTDSTLPPPPAAPVDLDLAAQARPGHGVPAQDPNADAQFALEPAEAAREAKSVLVGGGTVGTVAGALGGAAAGGLADPQDPAGAASAPASATHPHTTDHG